MSPTPRVDITPAVIDLDCPAFSVTSFGPSEVLLDITGVGSQKPMGYVPVDSLRDCYKVDVDRLIKLLNSVGIETSIERGTEHRGEPCLYAYDRAALTLVLLANRETVEQYGWSIDPTKFVQAVEREYVPIEEDLHRVIAEAFGDEISLEMWREHRAGQK